MKNMIGILMLGCVLGFSSCHAKKVSPSRDTVVFEKFQHESDISFTEFAKFEKGNFRRLYLSDSDLYVCDAQAGVGDYFFYRYSLNKKTLPDKYIKFGRGSGQALNAFSSGIHKKNTIWLHDISLNKILTLNLPTKETNGDSLSFHEYKLPDFFYSVELMDSSQLLGTGTYNTIYKVQKEDLTSGAKLNEFGVFSNPPKDIPFYSWTRSYESAIFLKPSEDKAVLACRYADQIEIFDVRNKKSKIVVKGPEDYEPDITPLKVQEKDIIQRNKKTRFAFVNGVVTDKYIYLLYSGNQHESEYKIDGMYIYVYDWNGAPVMKFNLDRYISGFTVSDKNTDIYAWDNNSKTILRAKLKI